MIKLFESGQAGRHQIGRKKFGERRSDRDRPRLSASEIHVSIDGETHSGLQMPIFHQLVARQPARLAQSQPCFDAAFVQERRLPSRRTLPRQGGLETAPPCNHAIVIENAMNPDPAHFAHGAIGKNRGVFDRNVALIIETICDPTAQCFGRKPAFVHGDVERMFVVVSARADGAQIFNERLAVPKPSGHKTISNPSHAISIPACSTCARSRVPGIRIGFVLLMCV